MIMPLNDYYEEARNEMIETQLLSRGIKDKKVLEAFRKTPRHLFVPENLREHAYEDRPLPLIGGQTISQPYIVALMTELLVLPKQKCVKILEVGSGSGYQAAILGAMNHKVFSIERLPELANMAKKNLRAARLNKNISISVGDGSLGMKENAPFDRIIVTAAAPQIPQALIEQLNIGGYIVIPCGDPFIQEMLQVVKTGFEEIEINRSIGCRFVPLLGKDGFKSV
jgi:protein-L-isoaspartate(D-aspartate) O-methyltransferase